VSPSYRPRLARLHQDTGTLEEGHVVDANGNGIDERHLLAGSPATLGVPRAAQPARASPDARRARPARARRMTTRPRARIVCTLGPATSSDERVRALIDAGMDVARFNFSHGSADERRPLVARVRAAAEASGRAVGILADLQGPKIRLGVFPGGPVRLETGQEFVVTTEPVAGDAGRASTTYEALARDVRPGDTLLVDDGLVRLQALSSDGVRVVCRVIEGGEVSDHKGLNLPGVRISAPSLSAKDREDLREALALGADFVALSFVREPGDADLLRQAMDEAGRRVPALAKIEKPEAVERLEDIVDAFDGLMVARGDLGVELPLEQVPLVQKRAIRLARERAKPVIVATQMLESMITHSRPTRAEASDVANAVLDGADALMLSGETSVGHYPVEAVATMRRVIVAAESEMPAWASPLPSEPSPVPGAIARSAAGLAEEIAGRALVAFTRTGATARLLAAYRSPVRLLAFTTDPVVRLRLALVWGVEAFVVPEARTTEEMVALVDRAILDLGSARTGDPVVIVSGGPGSAPGSTDQLRVHRLGA
jgi:pyruvate kinase